MNHWAKAHISLANLNPRPEGRGNNCEHLKQFFSNDN